MKKTNKQKGITLVALVITIIILLILATISIQSLTNTGLFAKAQEAKEKTQNAEENQARILNEYEYELNKYVSGTVKETFKGATVVEAIQYANILNKNDNTELQDAYGNKIVVPAGFKIKANSTTNNAATVNQGIVIIDSNENEFVWIPVGKIYTDVEKTEKNAKTIELGRYDFDKTTGAKSAHSGSYVEEDVNDASTLTNTENKAIAKNITNFKNSIATNGGYYIGRYEARTEIARNNETDPITPVTIKGTDQVYNYVTQIQAAQLSQNMYNSNKFTSDLMNSYAWDTAILFLQTFGEDKYSIKKNVNASLATTGTNDTTKYTGTQDVQCNVYDMASNIYEWTTETTGDSYNPCVYRGGSCYNDYGYASFRGDYTTSGSNASAGFRPILFV